MAARDPEFPQKGMEREAVYQPEEAALELTGLREAVQAPARLPAGAAQAPARLPAEAALAPARLPAEAALAPARLAGTALASSRRETAAPFRRGMAPVIPRIHRITYR